MKEGRNNHGKNQQATKSKEEKEEEKGQKNWERKQEVIEAYRAHEAIDFSLPWCDL